MNIEPLESRIAPAAVFKFTDVDGDAVTITTSKGSNADLAAIVVTAASGIGQELQRIDFSLNAAVFATSSLTVTAKRTAAGGDGLVNVGYIDASTLGGGTALDLGVITIRGDLGRIDAGDASTGTTAVKGLSVQSMGEFGTSTQQAGGNLVSHFNGALGSLKVAGDMREVALEIQGGPDGKIGPITIGGSLIGGASQNGGSIKATGAMGPVKVGGDIEGGTENSSGFIITEGTLASISLGGSLVGGSGTSILAGAISSTGAMGPVKIGGNVSGGSGSQSGVVSSGSTLAGITVGGSLLGGTGDDSGKIISLGAMGPVKIVGNIVGSDIDGAGTLEECGFIRARRIASLTVFGSIISGTESGGGTLIDCGAVRAVDDIGTITIKGSLIGNATNPVLITARGQATPGAASDIAIKSLTVGGRVELTDILAGYSTSSTPVGVNADAQIGAVVVGDWIASNLVAGVQDDATATRNAFFGDGDDQKIAGGSTNIISKIASITIKGTARGTVGAGDSFGFVAQQIGSFKIGATAFPLTAGAANDTSDLLVVGITGDLRVREVAL